MIVVEREKRPMAMKLMAMLLLAVLLVAALQVWHPWQRAPDVFYEPLFLPLEAVDGDLIVTESGGYIEINGNRTITSISHTGEGVMVIKSTRHMTVWEFLFGE